MAAMAAGYRTTIGNSYIQIQSAVLFHKRRPAEFVALRFFLLPYVPFLLSSCVGWDQTNNVRLLNINFSPEFFVGVYLLLAPF
jgi:hypothetical protein